MTKTRLLDANVLVALVLSDHTPTRARRDLRPLGVLEQFRSWTTLWSWVCASAVARVWQRRRRQRDGRSAAGPVGPRR